MSRREEELDTGFRIGASGSDTERGTTRLATRTWGPRASPCRDLYAQPGSSIVVHMGGAGSGRS